VKVYVVEVLNIDTSRVDKVFYTKSKANQYAKQLEQEDEWIQGIIIWEREVE
jgi:hypothetical protein